MVNCLYKEEQRLRQNLLWLLILIAPTVFLWIVFFYQFTTGKLVGDHPIENLPLVSIAAVYTLCSVYSLLFIKLSLFIYEDRIVYGWNIPTADLNEIPLSEIESLNVVKYSFVGYGYRISLKYGTVYNVGGNEGLQILKKSGTKLLLGTSRPSNLAEIVEKIKRPANNA